MSRAIFLCLTALLTVLGPARAQTREEKVRADRKKVEAAGFWIYNDLPRGFAQAKKTGKPLLVILRCIPCTECVKLDDNLVDQDKRLRPLLEKFVRVRVVSTNGLDLSLFQFDYDQSFAAFLLNADGTIYGRFGTRSHRTSWSDDVSIEGLAQALRGALELHREYPKNRAELVRKKGPAPDFPSPEKYPLLRARYGPKLADKGNIVPSCIHCHQIGDAQRQVHRDAGKPIPEQLLFPYPHPRTLGLVLDPKERATVLRVEKGSAAEKSGFQEGDQFLKLGGQPLLSIADVQWVLHRTWPGSDVAIKAVVRRGHRDLEMWLRLPVGWRKREDISWRASTWPLRRMATGGLLLEDLPLADRKKAGLTENVMALRVRHAGQYGPHGAAHRAGVRRGDVLISFGGRDDFRRETDLLVYALERYQPGEQVAVTVLRDGKKIKVKIPMQK